MATDYLQIPAVQQFDPTSCWAAVMEWWARATPNRAVITQVNLLNVYLRYWDTANPDSNPNYGTISRAGMIAVIEDSRWRMSCEILRGPQFTCQYVNTKMRNGPLVVAFKRADGSGHAVSVYGASNTHIACMDPDGARFRGLQPNHYQSSEVIVGIPKP